MSKTVNLKNYTIKDIPGSSGRLDVISRCILSALLNKRGFEDNIQIWVFLERYGTYIFDQEFLDYDVFPKNEILLSDFIVKLIKNKANLLRNETNPLKFVKYNNKDIFSVLKDFLIKNYKIFVLAESGEDFFNYLQLIKLQKNIIFVIGSQTGELIKSKALNELNLPHLSLGTQSYLASSVIRLIKLNLKSFI